LTINIKHLTSDNSLHHKKCQMSNVKCQMSNVKCQMSNVNQICLPRPTIILSLAGTTVISSFLFRTFRPSTQAAKGASPTTSIFLL